MIDTHTHIYLPEFDADRAAVIERARQAGISTMIMPAIDSKTHDAMLGVEASFPGCLSMIGLHPCSATNSYEKELKWYEESGHIITLGPEREQLYEDIYEFLELL